MFSRKSLKIKETGTCDEGLNKGPEVQGKFPKVKTVHSQSLALHSSAVNELGLVQSESKAMWKFLCSSLE